MTSNARESPSHSTDRNKENDPFQTKTSRQRFIPSLAKSPDKDEFFTDTLLDNSDASQRSLIPLPRTTKDNSVHPRKKIRTITSSRTSKPPQKHRATRSELPTLPTHSPNSPFTKKFSRDTSPHRSTGLSTPPRSRDGSSVASPINTFSSPPRALTETYERIDQEEDLAATEGEFSDPDDTGAEDKENEPRANGLRPHKNFDPGSHGHLPRSRDSTPTDRVFLHRTPRGKDVDLTTASVLSDPTGMSFVREVTDRNLQLVLTPLVLESAKDRQALEQVWSNRRPVAFSKAGRIAVDNIDIPNHSPSQENLPLRRLIPFSKAGRIKLASDLRYESHHHRAVSDSARKHTYIPDDVDNLHNVGSWHGQNTHQQATHHNSTRQRENFFKQNHGFPPRGISDEPQDEDFTNDGFPLRIQKSEQSTDRIPESQYAPQQDDQIHNEHGEDHNSNMIDWMQLAIDKPVNSVESRPNVMADEDLPNLQPRFDSPEKSRRLDVDFTGQSFQVSESPPVRSKIMAKDYSRMREIEGLEKRAVTTNRLNQLRARESNEQLQTTSRSPVLETIEVDRPKERLWRSNSLNGEKILSTSPLNFRTSLPNGFGRNISISGSRNTPDAARSHDILQRLARGSSSTPRSSTPSDNANNIGKGDVDKKNDWFEDDLMRDVHTDDLSLKFDIRPQPEFESEFRPDHDLRMVQQTPKVSGAWSDTVLPDTIKPQVRNVQNSKNIHTPHVSTGAWIDTPAPNAQSTKLDPVMGILQEVPEELMNGIVKDKFTAANQAEITKPSSEAPQERLKLELPPLVEESLAKKVLTEAKERSRNHGYGGAADDAENTKQSVVEDTLALGSATVQSLENFLDMDETDVTILSRINEDSLGPTETEVIFRLVSKLDRLRSHLHDAKKGLSHLEHQISQPQQVIQVAQPPDQIETKTECEECATRKPVQAETATNLEISQAETQVKSMLPFKLLSLVIPVPILFRRTRRSSTGFRSYLPEPTPLGWAVIALWSWYIVECLFSEIYSRPQYASRYSWPVLQEPEFPFVLPTMLYRWSRLNLFYPSVIKPLLGFFIGVFKIFGMWLGLIDGFVDSPIGGTSTIGGIYEQQQQQATVTGYGINTDMMNDEFL